MLKRHFSFYVVSTILTVYEPPYRKDTRIVDFYAFDLALCIR